MPRVYEWCLWAWALNARNNMIEYLTLSITLIAFLIAFLIRNETRIARLETLVELHIKNHNLFLKTLRGCKDAD